MKYKIVYTLNAKNDLRRLTLDLLDLTKDKVTVLHYIDEIQGKTNLLTDNPGIGSNPRDRVLLCKGYKFLSYKSYLIFYTADKENSIVYIHAILNSKKDYPKAMRNLI